MRLALGACAAGAGLVYIGLPAAVGVRALVAPKPVRRGGVPLPDTVSVVVAAYDEAASITTKLDDLVAQDLPGLDLEIVVASDGSTDATVALATSHPAGATVLDLPRGGKAAALNAALEVCRGGIVVFTDANSRLDPDALARLLEPFTDPEVGGVAGDQRYRRADGGAGDSERQYWGYERTLKRLESAGGSVVSSTGALHAVRRAMIDEIPGDVTDDFHLSTGVIAKGHRLVFEPSAMAWEEAGDGGGTEYRRKVRIITRGLTGVRRRRELLDPRRHGSYAGVLFLHKVARRLMFVPMLVALAASFRLRRESRAEALLWWGQSGFYGAAALGLAAGDSALGRHPIAALPAHFVRVNTAAAHALVNVLAARRYETWEHHRG